MRRYPLSPAISSLGVPVYYLLLSNGVCGLLRLDNLVNPHDAECDFTMDTDLVFVVAL